MDILALVSAGLGGGLLTAVIFVIGYSNKLTNIETRLTILEKMLNAPLPRCSAHQELSETVAILKSQVKEK